MDDVLHLSRPVADFDLYRRVGYDKKIIVHNVSGKDAWVILSPAPIRHLNAIEINNIGSVSFTHFGDVKCQQFGIKHNDQKEYDLDTSQIYYTVFFNCDEKWKCPYKDRKINAKIYNINLTPKNVDESVYVEIQNIVN